MFGPGVLRPDGSLDREQLGQLVFADPGLRAKLNAIVHPLVHERMRQLERHAIAAPDQRGQPAAIVVHDVPLLAENGLGRGFDTVLVVDAPDDQRLQRLIGHPRHDGRARPGPDGRPGQPASSGWPSPTS